MLGILADCVGVDPAALTLLTFCTGNFNADSLVAVGLSALAVHYFNLGNDEQSLQKLCPVTIFCAELVVHIHGHLCLQRLAYELGSSCLLKALVDCITQSYELVPL